VSAQAVVATAREMLTMTLMLVSPFLAAAVLSSLVVGLLQAGTRVNDLTLSFVPRFAAVLLVIYIAASWALGQLTGYIERITAAVRAFAG
jgi:flagellar biosynthetic protein FliQ